MSDTQSIYKSVLGLNETGGTFLAYLSTSKYVRTTTTLAPFKVATPIVSISSTHPFDVKIVGLQPSPTLRLLTVDQLFEMRMNSAFSNNPRIFRFSNQFVTRWVYSTFTFQFFSYNFHVKYIQPSHIKQIQQNGIIFTLYRL